MDSETEKVPISRLTEQGRTEIEDVVAREFPLTIILNDQELVTLLCSPKDLNYLAIGFLFSEGLLRNKSQIKKIMVDDQRGVVRVEAGPPRPYHRECNYYRDGLCTNPKGAFYRQMLPPDNPGCATFERRDDLAQIGELPQDFLFRRFITSGCGRGASFYSAADVQDQRKVESKLQVSTSSVFSLVSEFQRRSQVYRSTGGVHSAALCDTEGILVFNEDIGRHNAIDKIFGECTLKDISTIDKLVITSGRISSEILLKVAKRNIPVIISKSAPTNLGVKLANDLGITLLGFVRGKRMNAYSNEWRVAHGQ